MSELLVAYVGLWKTLHSSSMERSAPEEADSNKPAIFRRKKKVLSYCRLKLKMLTGLLPKYGTERNLYTD